MTFELCLPKNFLQKSFRIALPLILVLVSGRPGSAHVLFLRPSPKPARSRAEGYRPGPKKLRPVRGLFGFFQYFLSWLSSSFGSTNRPVTIFFWFPMQKQRSSQFFSLNGHFLAKILWSKGRRPQKLAKKDQNSFFLEIFKSCLIIMKFILEVKKTMIFSEFKWFGSKISLWTKVKIFRIFNWLNLKMKCA
jgi:hypothetical protein